MTNDATPDDATRQDLVHSDPDKPATASNVAKPVGSTRPWDAEHELTAEYAAQLIDAQFQELAPSRTTLFGQGWDNTAFLVNESFVFRFPRREVAAAAIESEIAVLPKIESRFSTSIPRLTHIGEPAQDFPWRFVGYPCLQGNTACRVALSDAQRGISAASLGKFLRELHDIREQEALGLGAPFDLIGRLEIPKRTQQAFADLDQVPGLQNRNLLREFLTDIEQFPPIPAQSGGRSRTLVHGDLYVRHLIVDADGGLRGVIDWGDIHCGDPAIDLGLVFSYLPPAAHEIFFAHYGEICPTTRRMALLRALQHTLRLVPFAADIQDQHLLDSARRSLHWVSEILRSD